MDDVEDDEQEQEQEKEQEQEPVAPDPYDDPKFRRITFLRERRSLKA